MANRKSWTSRVNPVATNDNNETSKSLSNSSSDQVASRRAAPGEPRGTLAAELIHLSVELHPPRSLMRKKKRAGARFFYLPSCLFRQTSTDRLNSTNTFSSKWIRLSLLLPNDSSVDCRNILKGPELVHNCVCLCTTVCAVFYFPLYFIKEQVSDCCHRNPAHPMVIPY